MHDVGDLEHWGEPVDSASLAVLALHGRGQDPGFMRALTERWPSVPKVAYIAPRAPGASWYPLPFMAPMTENEPALSYSLQVVDEVLAHVRGMGFAPQRTVLLGFSQGACLLCEHLLRRPAPYAAVVALTGGYLGPQRRSATDTAALRGVPVIMRSVEQDPWVPSSRVHETGAIFAAMGARIDLRVEPGDSHIVTDEAVASVHRLLTRVRRTRR